jgi:hypothetical protein
LIYLALVGVVALLIWLTLTFPYLAASRIDVHHDSVLIQNGILTTRTVQCGSLSAIRLCGLKVGRGRPSPRVLILDRTEHALASLPGRFWTRPQMEKLAQELNVPVLGDFGEALTSTELVNRYHTPSWFDRNADQALVALGLVAVAACLIVAFLLPSP